MLQQIADYHKGGYISADDLATCATVKAAALNGARDWSEYSWGGSALVYDGDIAAACAAPASALPLQVLLYNPLYYLPALWPYLLPTAAGCGILSVLACWLVGGRSRVALAGCRVRPRLVCVYCNAH